MMHPAKYAETIVRKWKLIIKKFWKDIQQNVNNANFWKECGGEVRWRDDTSDLKFSYFYLNEQGVSLWKRNFKIHNARTLDGKWFTSFPAMLLSPGKMLKRIKKEVREPNENRGASKDEPNEKWVYFLTNKTPVFEKRCKARMKGYLKEKRKLKHFLRTWKSKARVRCLTNKLLLNPLIMPMGLHCLDLIDEKTGAKTWKMEWGTSSRVVFKPRTLTLTAELLNMNMAIRIVV